MTDTKPKEARKQPADHLSKADRLRDEKPAGWHTLRPITDLRSGEIAEAQAGILDIFEAVGIDMSSVKEGEELDIPATPEVVRAFGKLGSFLEAYAVDKDAFIKVDKGPGAQARIADLAMWYLAQLGESESSAS